MAITSLGFLATLLLGVSQAQVITSDTYFYGQSPPVYPSPAGNGAGDWAGAYAKAKTLVAKMTLEEKINMTTGITVANGCSGNIQSIPRLGFPGICLSDAGQGVRGQDFVNAYPNGLHVGASWNKSSAMERAVHLGSEFFAKGVNVMLGPVVGPIGRVLRDGRAWEGFGSDPYLVGALAYETIAGIQSVGVTTSIKHLVANEQETNRMPNPNEEWTDGVAAVSSNIDDRTMHELYMWPFQDAVRAGTGCAMCSYNRINNSYACQNSKLMNGLFKTELGFQGFIVSDWTAMHSGIATYAAGMEIPFPGYKYGEANFTAQWTNGSLPTSRLDDISTRILASWYYLGQDKTIRKPGSGMASSVNSPHKAASALSLGSKSVLLSGAEEGHVLVKNTGALPLKNPQLLSLFGYDALANTANAFFFDPVPYVNYSLISGGGSGTPNPAYTLDMYGALAERAFEDETSLLTNFFSNDNQVDPDSDACLVFLNAYSVEGADRPGLTDDWSDSIVQDVASKCSNTIVIIHNTGARVVDAWITNKNVTALIFAHNPGQDAGRALVNILYGDVSPSGKLPYTVAKSESDYGALLNPSLPEGIFVNFPQSNFTEGVYTDYRAFDKAGIAPRYEFGFGLTYSTFSFSDLSIALNDTVSMTPLPPSAAIIPGGNPRLFDIVLEVSCTVKNTGSVAAAEVAQLYVGIPGPNTPVRQLRGFEKVMLQPGQQSTVNFQLTRRDLSYWDVNVQNWRMKAGTYMIYVGNSSRKLSLKASFPIGK